MNQALPIGLLVFLLNFFWSDHLFSKSIDLNNSKSLLYSVRILNADGYPVAQSLIKGKIVGLYFSAGWCGSCRSFTPDLIDFRNKHQREFEVILVGADGNSAAQKNYMKKYNMPWLAVKNQSEDSRFLLSATDAALLPSLIILNYDGQIISREGVTDIKNMSVGALEFWKKN